MDFRLSEEQKTARDEMFRVCRELAVKAPPGWQRGTLGELLTSDEAWQYHLFCAKEFARRGWLSIDWPTDCGGQGRSKLFRLFLNEAAGYYRVPGTYVLTDIAVAPIIEFGTPEQKREFLPPVAAGDATWAVLWSEPGAGSDVAAGSTSGVRNGDYYVVNGQKTWTTGAHRADWGFLMFRSDSAARPRHRGLSCICADLRTPGITVRPIPFMNLAHTYNDVFLDDVRIPARNLIGGENGGWRVMRAAMSSERSLVGALTSIPRDLDDLVDYCRRTSVHGGPLSKDPLVRNRLAQLACDLEAARALSCRTAWLEDRGVRGSVEASAVKVFAGELAIRLAYLGSDILGVYGQVKTSHWSPIGGLFEDVYQSGFANSIASGTNEIQRNVIAWEGLGLPRMR